MAKQIKASPPDGTGDALAQINLDTLNGFYHWGVFTSDEKVNQFLARAYERTPNLKTLEKNSSKGSITAAFAPPQVTIPSNAHLNLSQVLYQITFDSGTLVSNNKGNTDLKGWKIALKCELDTSQVPLNDTDDSPERDFIKNEFQVSSDRAQADRLFVKLAEANWNRFDDSSMIIDPDTGKPISFNDWQDKIDGGADDDDVEDDRPDLFRRFVQQWAKSIQKVFATTLAICTPRSSENAKLNPTQYLTQIYAYESANGNTAKNGKVNSSESNSIVYLGMSQSNFPQAKQLLYQGQVLSETKMTLVIGHQLYMEQFLLPVLKKFNSATSLSLTVENGWEFSYEVGLDAAGPKDDNPSFEFARSEDGSTYTYYHDAKTPGAPIPGPGNKVWYQPEHWGITKNTLTFDAKTRTATLKGSVEYCEGVKVASSQDMSGSTNFYRNAQVSSWELLISLTLKDGVLGFAFEDIPSFFETPALMASDLHKKVAKGVRRSINAAPKDMGISILSADLPSFWGAGPINAKGPIILSNAGGAVLALVEEGQGTTKA